MKLELDKNQPFPLLKITEVISPKDANLLTKGMRKMIDNAKGVIVFDFTKCPDIGITEGHVMDAHLYAIFRRIPLIVAGPYENICQVRNLNDAFQVAGIPEKRAFANQGLIQRAGKRMLIRKKQLDTKIKKLKDAGRIEELKSENKRLNQIVSAMEDQIEHLLRTTRPAPALEKGDALDELESEMKAVLKDLELIP